MQKNLKSSILLKLTIAIAILIVYLPLFNGFFQQDEWLVFGNFFGNGPRFFFELVFNSLALNVGHYVPFTLLTFSVFAASFKLNYIYYVALSLILHILIIYLVYLLSNKIVKNKILSSLIAVLFGYSAAGYQATAWVIADINTHGATIFALLSLILLFKFLESKKLFLFMSSVAVLITSLLFKETAMAFFILLPVVFYLYGDKNIINRIIYPLSIGLIGAIYIIFRALLLFIPEVVSTAQIAIKSQSTQEIIYNLLSFPPKVIVQTIFPLELFLALIKKITFFLPSNLTGEVNTHKYDIFVETTMVEIVSLILFLLLIFAVLFLIKKSFNKSFNRGIVFGFLFAILNSFIYAFSPGRTGIISVIDSRNLYFPSIGVFILLVILMAQIAGSKKKILLFLFTVFLSINILLLNLSLKEIVNNGLVRKNILYQVKSFYPDLPNKVLIYTESNTAYYGLSENIMPFQSGFGQTLLVWYHSTESFPKEFFKDSFLWEITSQGYKESNNRGFGYFRNFEELSKTVKDDQLSPSSVIAFRYDSEKQIVEDMTEEMRGRLEGYLMAKQAIPQQLYILSSTQNQKDLQYVKDGNRHTNWDSKLPYEYPQSITIEFPTSLIIAQIQIDSYNNKDQNEVGYKILLSQGGENWKEVFYAERYVPDKEGIVNIYIKPQQAKIIKIEQVGYHQFASWVIHELKLYEESK